MSRFRLLAVAVLLLSGLAATPGADAQTRWLQTVQVVTPVSEYGSMPVLMDSLVNLARRGEIEVRREPGGAPIGFRSLESNILNSGLDFTSANQVFVTYKMEGTQRGFSSTIEDFYFIYRPEGYEDVDTPILYVDATQPKVRHVINNGGTQLLENEAAFEPFSEQISFAQLDDSAVVTVGGRVIRDPERGRAERMRVLSTIRRFMY